MKKRSTRFFTVLLLLAFLCAAVACKPLNTETNPESGTNTDKNENESNMNHSIADEQTEKSYVSLNGKKIIFIGCSFIYYGQTVLDKGTSTLTQDKRNNDLGYFYQLCRQNHETVSVTNWTFGGHTLGDLTGGNCAANRGCDGVDHMQYLTDRNYDYVVLTTGSGERSDVPFMEDIDRIENLFRQANPNVRFVFLCNAASYGISSKGTAYQMNILNNLKTLEKRGFIIVDWGNPVTDIINGKTKVPGATQQYNQNSFIIRKSAADGYHPNLLTGYITTLMTYCAITGRSAQGQPYAFCGDKTINSKYNFNTFVKSYYTYGGATTNFKEVFESEADMSGIQQLVDLYLTEKPYLKYGE